LEVTPNRPDLNSVIGIAREIAALTGNPLRVPSGELLAGVEPAASLVSVRLDASDLCPRYSARVVKGVKVGPSPDWLRSALEKVGLRSINNVVDVSNFVMLETGQPLHTFDYHLLAKDAAGRPAIVVRRAAAGERFVTLDGKEHTLATENLLIADESKAIALAGVMGGLNTEINASTVDVLIEAAYFTATNIRRTSKTLGLRTDASYRFERGADINACEQASRRCAQLILETAGGVLADGVVEAYPEVAKAKEVSLRHAKTGALLGIEIPVETQAKMLASLGLSQKSSTAEPALNTWSIPSWRVDLKRESDLIEEIARLYGVDKIPSTAPRGAVGSHAFDAVYDQFAEVRRILSGL
jgi:phenylalanyl-tRNA synthetase beta chain